MNGAEPLPASPDSASATGMPDAGALIASLRAAGAAGFDPARLHYLETLARRAAGKDGPVGRVLQQALAEALAAFRQRFERARSDAAESLARHTARHPAASAELHALHAAGDFRGMRRLASRLEAAEARESLRGLVSALNQLTPDDADGQPKSSVAVPRPELKALRNFRSTWSRLSVDKQVSRALEQAPRNAGPINSHMLALRSLTLMREISPGYLDHFMTYAETLLGLDQDEPEKTVKQKKRPAAKAARK
ncbi:DUF2894 domain-containing protein [Noviherbaspirillum aridicola]|uniref:DUF2894 family protein n=1 Tax=Noviherbaspirillum aridicola TaxID=2849687 RepID=A0ABQ4PZS8_9BURK|nr:DUF2894 domain-containing protein [Noviherbaspirillum aridicola]GIZ50257.1 hypothetical protein NCCP691_02710 [Noviherbaspirillum aridicola]